MDVTLTRVDRFPNGQAVKAYPISNWLNSNVDISAAAVGTESATATMTSGSLTFTGLTENTRYVAYASVGGDKRYVFFTASDTSATSLVHNNDPRLNVGAITGARDDPEEALANLLTALEDAGLITDSTTAT